MRGEPERGDGFQLKMSLKAGREALREPWEGDLAAGPGVAQELGGLAGIPGGEPGRERAGAGQEGGLRADREGAATVLVLEAGPRGQGLGAALPAARDGAFAGPADAAMS